MSRVPVLLFTLLAARLCVGCSDASESTSVPDPTEAGKPGATVHLTADRMNVLYVGVANPVTFSVAGAPVSDLRVAIAGAGGAMKRTGRGRYEVTVSTPGECALTAGVAGRRNTKFPLRAKRIPDPVARLGSHAGGQIGTGEFRAQMGLAAVLDGFDFDVRCAVAGFQLTYLGRRMDPVSVVNRGARFNDKVRSLVRRAKPGDIYLFEDVRAKAPGDQATRRINSLVFHIR